MIFPQSYKENLTAIGGSRIKGANVCENLNSQSCIECETAFPDDLMRDAVANSTVPRCKEESCRGLVKPDIVFFGEQLPPTFLSAARSVPGEADLCLVMGTSLSVQPFASLPGFVDEMCPRVLINQERVGGLGSRLDDVLLLGNCDAGVRKLAAACGWLEELEGLWASMGGRVLSESHDGSGDGGAASVSVEDEVEKLTRDVDRTLKIAEANRSWLSNHLEDKAKRIDDKGEIEEKVKDGEAKQHPVAGGDSSKEIEHSIVPEREAARPRPDSRSEKDTNTSEEDMSNPNHKLAPLPTSENTTEKDNSKEEIHITKSQPPVESQSQFESESESNRDSPSIKYHQ